MINPIVATLRDVECRYPHRHGMREGHPSVKAWTDASLDFARGASGTVRVLQEDSVWSGSVWASTEYPALVANPDVNAIIGVDPRSGIQVLMWTR
jgi:hypothetical protein